MPDYIQCLGCESSVFGFTSLVKPVGREDCPFCGGTDFEFLGDTD